MFGAAPLTKTQRDAIAFSRKRMADLAKARGWRKRVTYLFHTAIVFAVIGLLRLMPVDVASGFAGWIGRRLLAPLLPLKSMYSTVRVPFPNMSDDEIRTLLIAMSDNVVRSVAELAHLGAFAGRDNPRFVLSGLEQVEAARADGRGVLFVGGHFGNWELFQVAIRSLGLEGAVVVQHPSNPHVVGWLARQRYRYGLDEQIASGEKVYWRVLNTLKSGRVVQMLSDQQPSNGVKVPFFGLDTATNVVPARAARETGAAIVMMSMRRTRGARFELKFMPPMWVNKTDDRVADELRALTAINEFYEGELRATPAHWLWGHPRWSDALEGRPAKATSSTDGG
jgi:KDO2-lipid IV(A) lauroyltransferase